jgi:hypothetical protein
MIAAPGLDDTTRPRIKFHGAPSQEKNRRGRTVLLYPVLTPLRVDLFAPTKNTLAGLREKSRTDSGRSFPDARV